jgi:Icc protein
LGNKLSWKGNVSTKDAGDGALKLVLVGDIHLGPNTECRPGEEAPELMTRFVRLVNEEIKPDLVIEMGDRFNNKSHNEDLEHARQLNAILKNLSMPCLCVIGNHDVQHVSKAETEQVFGGPVSYRTVSIRGFRLVFLDTTEPVIEHVGGSVSERQLGWLETQLGTGDEPKIVFGHHPLDEQSLDGNPHFVKFPPFAYIRNREQVRQVLRGGRNVLAYINGHVHWFNYFAEYAWPCISVPSFTEAWPERTHAPGMFAEAVLTADGGIEASVRSMNPQRVLGKFRWTRQSI